MTADRFVLLETVLKRRLVDTHRHVRALEHAAAGFGDDFDLNLFESAWRSDDPVELIRAYAVQAGYQNVINACVKIAQELAELQGWTARGVEPTSVEALKVLHERGVISGATRGALKEAQERRSDIQHDDANVVAAEIHAAAQSVIQHAPLLLQDVAAELRQQR